MYLLEFIHCIASMLLNIVNNINIFNTNSL